MAEGKGLLRKAAPILTPVLSTMALASSAILSQCWSALKARVFSRGVKGTDKNTKNVGVEEANPRHPHFCVTGKNQNTGAGDRRYFDEEY
ncbi:hypothetical protein [Oscillibacter sp.]|uniref:hypothetical protein n=1 Tax=Oscillibacter sp. TaxID=1945593 RepID=UPI0028994EB5|nr:hypothetical protein [Oscillibacter sp.]